MYHRIRSSFIVPITLLHILVLLLFMIIVIYRRYIDTSIVPFSDKRELYTYSHTVAI